MPVFNLTIHLGDGRHQKIVATPIGGARPGVVIENDPISPMPWGGLGTKITDGEEE